MAVYDSVFAGLASLGIGLSVLEAKGNRKMIDNTINDVKTIAASGKDAILAGRYRILSWIDKGGRIFCV